MVIASTKDEPKFFAASSGPQEQENHLRNSGANYHLPFKACVLHHYDEVSFCNASPGDFLRHMSNLL